MTWVGVRGLNRAFHLTPKNILVGRVTPLSQVKILLKQAGVKPTRITTFRVSKLPVEQRDDLLELCKKVSDQTATFKLILPSLDELLGKNPYSKGTDGPIIFKGLGWEDVSYSFDDQILDLTHIRTILKSDPPSSSDSSSGDIGLSGKSGLPVSSFLAASPTQPNFLFII